MVTLAQLRDARFGSMEAASREWTRLATAIDEGGARAANGIAGTLMASVWEGSDADAAYRELDRQDGELRIAAQEACGVAPLVDTALGELTAAQNQLRGLLVEAEGSGLAVSEDGQVHPPDGADLPAHSHATTLTADIAGVLARADRADRELGQGVGQLAAEAGRPGQDRWGDAAADGQMVATLAHISADGIPKAGPEDTRAWWAGLSEGERQRYLIAYPQLLGTLDGLPATVRDRANRLVLHATESALRAELDAEKVKLSHVTGGTRGSGVTFIRRIDDLKTRLKDVEKLRSRLDFAGKHTGLAYLLAFAPNGDAGENDRGRGRGRAVVALGNPDRARHTAVFVPGMGSGLDDAGPEIDRMDALGAAARAKAGGAGVATVTWIGYDAPDKVDEALDPRYAEKAAPDLNRFVGGLRAAHDAATADHVTVIGHSYGSFVVGEAAQAAPGLRADDIVAVGSPGMHTTDAGDLGTAPGHVWSAATANDPVPKVGPLTLSNPITGNTPTDRSFNANRFTTDGARGHSGYWDEDHPDALNNQGAVIAGAYDDVRLMWGTPPPTTP